MLGTSKFGINNGNKNRNGEKKRYAIYKRVSTTEQAEKGYSLEEQERTLREAVESIDGEVSEVYEDAGISGKNITGRPGIQRLLQDVKDGKIDVVICWKYNRIARNMLDLLEVAKFLESYNVGLRSLSEPFQTETKEGRFLFNMMAAVGEFERGTISENVKMGMLARARTGKWNGGIVLGYDVVKTGIEEKGQSSRLEVNQEEANIVKTIFDMYAKGNGYKAIANALNKQGYKSKKNNDFAVATIREILRNPIYIGKIRYNVRQNWNEKRRKNINPDPIIVDGEHEAIIDLATWEKVQFNLSQSEGKPTRIYDGEFPLTGILRCPQCGAGMVIGRTSKLRKDGTRKRTAYYVCGASKNKGSAVCKANGIRAEKVNEVVFNKLGELMNDPKLIKRVVDSVNHGIKHKVNPAKKQMAKLEKDLANLVAKKQKAIEVYEDGIISKSELATRLEKFREDEEQLKSEIQNYKMDLQDGESEAIPYELVAEVMSSFEQLLNVAETQEQKKKLLHMLIDKITINQNKELDSIQIKINDDVINYIAHSEEVSNKDASSFNLRHNLWGRGIRLKIVV